MTRDSMERYKDRRDDILTELAELRDEVIKLRRKVEQRNVALREIADTTNILWIKDEINKLLTDITGL
jgi:Mg2+ and Co2+ transporter CorA